jgi:hypothetical protein
VPLAVTVKGLDKVKRDIEHRYGKAELTRRGQAALKEAADTILVPAVRSQTPPSNPTSPWRRPGSRDKHPGPMAQRAYSKRLKTRTDEVAAQLVGIKTSHTAVVVKGSKPHFQPKRNFQHPGAMDNDIFGRAVRSTDPAAIAAAVLAEILKGP